MNCSSVLRTFVDNTKKPLRYHRGISVVVFQYYQHGVWILWPHKVGPCFQQWLFWRRGNFVNHQVNIWNQDFQVRPINFWNSTYMIKFVSSFFLKINTDGQGRDLSPSHALTLADFHDIRSQSWPENLSHIAKTTSYQQFIPWFWKSEQKSKLSISNKLWQNAFRSDPESNHIFLHLTFQLHTWFIFCFFSYVVIIHLLWRG